MNNRDRLMKIMSDYKLERTELTRFLGVGRDEVDSWLISRESERHRETPDMAIELLKLKLNSKAKAVD